MLLIMLLLHVSYGASSAACIHSSTFCGGLPLVLGRMRAVPSESRSLQREWHCIEMQPAVVWCGCWKAAPKPYPIFRRHDPPLGTRHVDVVSVLRALVLEAAALIASSPYPGSFSSVYSCFISLLAGPKILSVFMC